MNSINKEKNKMLQIAPRRKLKPFKEVTKHVGLERQIRRLAEALDLTKSRHNSAVSDETTTLSYFIMSIPKDCTYAEKMDRLSEVADTILDVEGSDVLCFSMWVPSGQ
jgi:hypothetical protein